MFHRFHDLKTSHEPDIMSGGVSRSSSNSSSSSSSTALPGSRPLFPSMLRQDLTPGPQVTSAQYPAVSSPEPSFVGQGASLMALGHNVMFPGSKIAPGAAHDAHRYMAEAYRLAAGDHESHRLSYGSSGTASQAHLADSHRNTADHVSTPLTTHSQRQSGNDKSFGTVEMSSHLNIDSARMESHSARALSSLERLPQNVNRASTSKSEENENPHYGKSAYSSSASNTSHLSSHTTKGKNVSGTVTAGSQMFPMSFPHYQQYSEENTNFKRQYFDESFGHRREAITNPSSSEGNTSQLNQERSNREGAAETHGNRFDNQCPSQEAFSRDNLSRNDGRPDVGSELSLLAQATTSAHSELLRSKMSKGRQGKVYKCQMCNLEFKNGTQLKNHTWRHSGEKPHACSVCQATFTQLSNLKTHMRIHTGERPYACQECNATFTQISNLRTHQKIHTGEKPYECDVCFTRFSQQSNLKSHKLIHSGERPFKCEECGVSFVQSTHLRNHKRIHTNERPYGCEQCGARFRQLSNLKTHEKIHTGERPHSCEECGSTFAQKSNLKSHMLKLHATDGISPNKRGRKKKLEAIRPFTCEECGAKFTMMSNLKIHMRLHTGEKPFQCETCGASFAQRSNLKTHEQTHSEERPFKCSECPAAFRQNTNLKTHKMKKHPVKSLKIKILQDSEYIMQEMPPSMEGEGPAGSSHLIGEPIVQIREGKGDHFHLLGDGPGGGSDMVKLEGKMYDRQDTQGRNSDMVHDACPPHPNPYDTPNF